MSGKFIPNGDLDFDAKANSFANTIAKDPARFEISQADSNAMSEAAAKFRAALHACRSRGKSQITTRRKEEAREQAVRIMRRLGHMVRSNLRLDAATKMALGIQPRVERPKILTVPHEAPELRFVRSIHEGVAPPVHELAFTARGGKSRPPGAVRLELFVDLIPPDEPIAEHPGANHHSRAWYLRSFTRSPIRLIPPLPRMLMRVVYWGRWADSQGNVGPLSTAVAASIEGGTAALLPGGPGLELSPMNGRHATRIIEDAREPGPAGRDPAYSVALLEVRYGLLNAGQIAAVLPAPVQPESRRLTGPAEAEAEAA